MLTLEKFDEVVKLAITIGRYEGLLGNQGIIRPSKAQMVEALLAEAALVAIRKEIADREVEVG